MAHSSKQMHIMITNILSFHFYSDTSAYSHFFNVFFIIFNEDYPALSGQLSHFPLPVDQLAFPCLFLLSHVWRHERKGKQETGNGSTEASDHITVLSPSLWAMSSHWDWWATINMPLSGNLDVCYSVTTAEWWKWTDQPRCHVYNNPNQSCSDK